MNKGLDYYCKEYFFLFIRTLPEGSAKALKQNNKKYSSKKDDTFFLNLSFSHFTKTFHIQYTFALIAIFEKETSLCSIVKSLTFTPRRINCIVNLFANVLVQWFSIFLSWAEYHHDDQHSNSPARSTFNLLVIPWFCAVLLTKIRNNGYISLPFLALIHAQDLN